VTRAPSRRYNVGTMTSSLGTWMLGFGAFLVVAGVVGFVTNPRRVGSALLSGVAFGGLSFAWGVLLRRGVGWAVAAALVSTAVLAAVLGWRGSRAWILFVKGQPLKLAAAVIMSAMLLASLVTIGVLLGGIMPATPG
jgi:uncharacterized membrane protein (UPF0136 family)